MAGLRKGQLFLAITLSAVFIACGESDSVADRIDSAAPKRVHPPEALKLADSAFHTYFMKNDSASLKQALSLYYQSLELDPDNFITLNNIWQLENRLSLHDEALETSRKMLRMSNYDITCIGMVGSALDRTGDSVQARRYYQWSLETTENILDTMDVSNPSWITVQMNKASMYTMLGDQQTADEVIDYLAANVDSNMAEGLLKFKGKTRNYYLKLPEKVE